MRLWLLSFSLFQVFAFASNLFENTSTHEVEFTVTSSTSKRMTVRATNNYSDLSQVGNLFQQGEFAAFLCKMLPQSNVLKSSDFIAILSEIKRQVGESFRDIRKSSLTLPPISVVEKYTMMRVSMALLEMKRWIRDVNKLLSTIPDDLDLAGDERMPQLLGQLLRTALIPFAAFDDMSSLWPEESKLLGDYSSVKESSGLFIKYSSVGPTSEPQNVVNVVFLSLLPKAIQSIYRLQSRVHSLKLASLEIFYMDRMISALLKVLLEVFSLRSFVKTEHFIEMINAGYYPKSGSILGWSLSAVIGNVAAFYIRDKSNYLFKKEQWLVKWMQETMQNLYDSVYLNSALSNAFVKRMIKKVWKDCKLGSPGLISSPMMVGIKRIMDRDLQKALLLSQKRIEKKTKTREVKKVDTAKLPPPKKAKGKGALQPSSGKSKKAIKVEKADDEIAKEMKDLSLQDQFKTDEENLDAVNEEEKVTSESSLLESQQAFWESAPASIKQPPTLQLPLPNISAGNPFETIDFYTCNALPQFMLVGQFCQTFRPKPWECPDIPGVN